MRTFSRGTAAAAVAALVVLAACGGDETEPEDDPPPAPTQDTEETSEPDDTGGTTAPDDSSETTAPADGGGDTAAPPVAGDDEFSLGYILPETGQLAYLGPPQIEAVGLALSDINEAGGVLGNQVPDPVGGDEAGQESVAQASADRVLQANPSGIVGAASSGMSLAIIDRITGGGVMQCSGSNTAPTFTDYEDDGLYIRTAPSDALQGPILADTIVADGWGSVAIVARADDYGTGLAEATATALGDQGVEVVANDTYDPNATDFSAAVEAAASANPDAVVIIAFEEGTQIMQLMIEQGLTPQDIGYYGADGLRNTDLASIVSPDDPSLLAGMKGTAPAAADNEEFVTRIEEFAPDLTELQFAPQVYDCVVVMALAAEAAQSPDAEVFQEEVAGVTMDGTECTTYADCLALLQEGEDIDYNGVSGPLDFTEAGEPGTASIEVYEFDDAGELQTLEVRTSGPIEE